MHIQNLCSSIFKFWSVNKLWKTCTQFFSLFYKKSLHLPGNQVSPSKKSPTLPPSGARTGRSWADFRPLLEDTWGSFEKSGLWDVTHLSSRQKDYKVVKTFLFIIFLSLFSDQNRNLQFPQKNNSKKFFAAFINFC